MITFEQAIDEIRESRCRMSEACGHDPAKLVQYLKTFNRKYAAQVERYRRKRRKTSAQTARVD